MIDNISAEEQLRKQILDLLHKYEDKEFMAVHGKCGMDLAAPRCAKRVRDIEKLITSYTKQRERALLKRLESRLPMAHQSVKEAIQTELKQLDMLA